MADQATYHNFIAEIEGSIVGQDPKNIAGKGKGTCVVFTVNAKWQNKIDSNNMYLQCKALGELGDYILENPDYFAQGDRVTLKGLVEEGNEYFRNMELEEPFEDEDGEEITHSKVKTRDLTIVVSQISPNFRFANFEDGDEDEAPKKPAKKRTVRKTAASKATSSDEDSSDDADEVATKAPSSTGTKRKKLLG